MCKLLLLYSDGGKAQIPKLIGNGGDSHDHHEKPEKFRQHQARENSGGPDAKEEIDCTAHPRKGRGANRTASKIIAHGQSTSQAVESFFDCHWVYRAAGCFRPAPAVRNAENLLADDTEICRR